MQTQVEDAYETVFDTHKPPDQFHAELFDTFKFFYSRTVQRPISVKEIRGAQRKLRDSCRTLMTRARKDAKRREAR